MLNLGYLDYNTMYISGHPLLLFDIKTFVKKVTEQWMRDFGYYLDILAVSCDSFIAEVCVLFCNIYIITLVTIIVIITIITTTR